MKRNILGKAEGHVSDRSLRSMLNAGFPSDPAVRSIRLQRNALQMEPVSGEVMPWGVVAAYAAALASTGFLLVMALTGGIG
jgi:hypothetical protein